jgi:hypothetical protein
VAKIFVIFAAVAALTLCVCAQNTQSTPATASISGTVFDAATSQPLKGANVSARSFQPGQGGRHFSSATTDAEGHFSLSGLTSGRYMVSASREDYVGQRRGGNGSGGKLLTIAPDQHVEDVILQLTPGAIITGIVKKADGKPIAGASVEVMRYFYEGGEKQLHGMHSPALTNPAGEYSFTGLAPGHYYLRASAGSVTESGKSDKSPAKEFYASAFYPGSSDLARAVELAIRPGEDLSGIDLTLPTAHPVDVAGRVLNAGNSIPAANAEVTMVEADGGSSSTRQSETDVKGNFALHDVLPGNYVIMAQVEQSTKKNKMLFGAKPLQVAKVNLSKIEVIIGPGADVSGRIHVEDKSDDKAKVDLSHISVELQPDGSSSVTALMPGVENASVNTDGSFSFADVPEGTYWLDFSSLPPGFYLKATGALDVLETGITISRGQALAPLDFTLSSNVARLEGDVSTTDQPAAGASVVLVPDGARNAQTRYYRQSMSDQSGRFSLRNIIPGDYKIFAFEDLERGAYLNPDFLLPFEDRAQTVHLQEDGYLSVRLEAIPASETSP